MAPNRDIQTSTQTKERVVTLLPVRPLKNGFRSFFDTLSAICTYFGYLQEDETGIVLDDALDKNGDIIRDVLLVRKSCSGSVKNGASKKVKIESAPYPLRRGEGLKATRKGAELYIRWAYDQPVKIEVRKGEQVDNKQ